LYFDLTIVNTCFRKRKGNLITYKSEMLSYQIILFVIRNYDKDLFGLKVLSRESLIIQHIVLVMDVRLKRREKRRCHGWAIRIKWWNLKDEKQCCFQEKILKEGCTKLHESNNDMWDRMAYEIRKLEKETLGE
jgi:hypothetical protein